MCYSITTSWVPTGLHHASIGTSWPIHIHCMHALLCTKHHAIRCYIILTSKHKHCYMYCFIPCSHITVLGSQILIYTEQTGLLWIALSVLLCHLFWSWCMHEIPESFNLHSQGSPGECALHEYHLVCINISKHGHAARGIQLQYGTISWCSLTLSLRTTVGYCTCKPATVLKLCRTNVWYPGHA